MTSLVNPGSALPSLRCAVVLRVHEQACEVRANGQPFSVGYVASFPAPRTERVCPGHLVALAGSPGETEAVIWRWYDAVVLAQEAGLVRLWEPGHGEVLAQQRLRQHRPPGTRAYLSAGLPGADWWVDGPVSAEPEDAEVDLDEVGRFATKHELWPDPAGRGLD